MNSAPRRPSPTIGERNEEENEATPCQVVLFRRTRKRESASACSRPRNMAPISLSPKSVYGVLLDSGSAICCVGLSALADPGVRDGFYGNRLLHQPEEEPRAEYGTGIGSSVNSGGRS